MNHSYPSLRVPHRTLLLAALLAAAGHATPALAQRSTDVEEVARSMKDAGATATRVAGELRRVHMQDALATTRTLRAVGYDATASAAALKTEFTLSGVDAFYALRDNGFAITTVLDALNANGMRVRLDCIGPRTTPVPCGPFGGNREQPAMSQVAWTPQSQGFTDSILTITGNDIPPVGVRIGATALTQLESTPTKVRARLPASPMTGPLSLVRNSDGVVGELVSSFAVEAAPVPSTRALFHIDGTSAWEEAHKQDFEFYPVPQAFLIVTEPRNGVDTRLQDDMPSGATIFARITMGELSAYGGIPGGTYNYRLFAGRDLADGWVIASVTPESPAKIAVQPAKNTATPAFELQIVAGLLQHLQAPIGQVVLEGPAGADWRDAFRQ